MANADQKNGKIEIVNEKNPVNETATEIVRNDRDKKNGATKNAGKMTGTARIASVQSMTRSVNIASESRRNTKNSNDTSSKFGGEF